MNIAFDWYMEYGMEHVDVRTRGNILSHKFIAFAKEMATPEEIEHIDACVKFQTGCKDGAPADI